MTNHSLVDCVFCAEKEERGGKEGMGWGGRTGASNPPGILITSGKKYAF